MNYNAVELMARSFDPVETEEFVGHCAATGIPIDRGVRAKKSLKTMNNIHAVLSNPSGTHLSEPVARMFANDWNMGSRVFFAEGENWHVLTNPVNAKKQGRKCWRDVPADLAGYKGEVVIILNTNYQKKCWFVARPTKIGASTIVTINNPDAKIFQNLTLNWDKVLELHELVRSIRESGFSVVRNKMAAYFDTSLLNNSKAVAAVGIVRAMEYDKQIEPYRNSDELLFVQHIEGYGL